MQGGIELLAKTVGKTQLAQAGFYRKLPWSNGTNEGAGVEALNEPGCSFGKFGGSFEKPDHRIGVEQEVHGEGERVEGEDSVLLKQPDPGTSPGVRQGRGFAG